MVMQSSVKVRGLDKNTKLPRVFQHNRQVHLDEYCLLLVCNIMFMCVNKVMMSTDLGSAFSFSQINTPLMLITLVHTPILLYGVVCQLAVSKLQITMASGYFIT